MRLLVRSWNLFHGNAHPPRRRGYLRRMVELAAADDPDVLCLQEVPVWALPRIDDWSGMRRAEAIARPPLWPGPLSAWVTRAHQGVFRSALAGQANAILVAARHDLEDLGHARISDHGRERRVAHAVRVAGAIVVVNLHATNEFAEPAVPLGEAVRALAFAESVARVAEPVVLAGDFNVRHVRLDGLSAPGAGIDHVLARGARIGPVVGWPLERRVQNGVVLSDHAPVEAVVELGPA